MNDRDKKLNKIYAAGFAAAAATVVLTAAFCVKGEFTVASGPNTAALLSAAALVLASIALGFVYFALRLKTVAMSAIQSAAWVTMGRLAMDITGGIDSPFYPFAFVFAAIAGAYAGTVYVFFGVAFFVTMETLQTYFAGDMSGSFLKLLLHAAGLFACAGIVGAFFRSERKKTLALEEELGVYKRGQSSFSQHADEFKSIREEGRRAQLIESVVSLQDALHKVLGDLHGILKPHTCILFTKDPKDGKLRFRDAVTDAKDLNRSAEIGEGEGLLGWVAREHEPLRLTTFQHPPENLVYYNRDEKIQSLLAVPVMRDDEKNMEGVVIVDSMQEGYFTTEDERLIQLAARQIAKELETVEIRRREINDARISQALYRMSENLNSSLVSDEVIGATMDCVGKLLDADLVAIALFDASLGLNKVVRAEGERAEEIVDKTFTPDESLVGWVTTPEQYLIYSDFRSGRRIQKPVFGKNFPAFRDIGTFFCYPLVSGSDFLGSLTVIFNEENAINDYERNALTTVARMAATSIANAELHRRVAQMATTDGLTGLYNHRYFQERLDERIEEAKRHPTRHSLVLVDIDHFKKVNDTYGHPVGDRVLKAMAKLLAESVRNVDLAARYGGEEFVLILANTKRDGAQLLAERIRKQAEKIKFTADGQSFRITISMGICTFPDDAKSKKSLIDKADQALYFAKENGRNRVVCYADIKKDETSHSQLLAQRL